MMINNEDIHYPALLVADDGWVDLIKDDTQLSKWNYIAIRKYNVRNVLFYDSSNNVWQIQEIVPQKPATFFKLLLAHTIYNPTVEVSIRLVEHEKMNSTDIISAIGNAIDNGNGLLTQFAEAGEIKESIRGKTTFKEIVSVLKERGIIYG